MSVEADEKKLRERAERLTEAIGIEYPCFSDAYAITRQRLLRSNREAQAFLKAQHEAQRRTT